MLKVVLELPSRIRRLDPVVKVLGKPKLKRRTWEEFLSTLPPEMADHLRKRALEIEAEDRHGTMRMVTSFYFLSFLASSKIGFITFVMWLLYTPGGHALSANVFIVGKI